MIRLELYDRGAMPADDPLPVGTHPGALSAGGRQATLTLPFATRQKSRFHAELDDGTEVGVVTRRGYVLRDGDLLVDDQRQWTVRVCAAPEHVSTVSSFDPGALLRAAYHLGNRHVPLQVGDRWLRYEHDHVLDAMVSELGLTVNAEQAPFEPEAGAYGHAHPPHHHSTGQDGSSHDHGVHRTPSGAGK